MSEARFVCFYTLWQGELRQEEVRFVCFCILGMVKSPENSPGARCCGVWLCQLNPTDTKPRLNPGPTNTSRTQYGLVSMLGKAA